MPQAVWDEPFSTVASAIVKMRIKSIAARLLTALTTVSLGGCGLIANLGQFNGATAAEPLDGSATDAGDAPGNDGDDDSLLGARDDGSDEGGETDVATGNLIENPGFEFGIGPWTTFIDGTILPTLDVTSTHAHSGGFSGWVTNRTQTFQGTVQDIKQRAIQGHTYVVSAWAMIGYGTDGGSADTGTGAGSAEPVDVVAKVTCLVDAATVVSYIRIGSATATSSSWAQMSGPLTVPACAMTALQVYVEGPAPGIDLYVDDVSVLP
jgi:Carbohydrate binding domain